MQIGVVGLGRMGANIVRRLMREGHTCVVFDVAPKKGQGAVAKGATGATSAADLVRSAVQAAGSLGDPKEPRAVTAFVMQVGRILDWNCSFECNGGVSNEGSSKRTIHPESPGEKTCRPIAPQRSAS